MKAAKLFLGLLSAALLMSAGLAQALEIKPYSSESLIELQGAGKSVAVHFHADWCSTCRVQERVFQQLQGDPELAGVTLLVANYDTDRALRQSMSVRSQSVIVVFRGEEETGRIGGETRPEAIRAALVTGR